MRDLAPIALCIPPPNSKKYYAEATTSSITTSFDFKIELLILLSFTIVHNYYANVLLMVLRLFTYEMLFIWQKLIDKTKFGNLYFFRYCLLTMLNNNLYKSLNISRNIYYPDYSHLSECNQPRQFKIFIKSQDQIKDK